VLQVTELKASQRALGAVRSRSGANLTAAAAVEASAAERAAELPLPLYIGATNGLSPDGARASGWDAVRYEATSGAGVRQSIAL